MNLPPRLRALMAAMTLLGTAAYVTAAVTLPATPDTGLLVLAVAFFVVGDVALVNIRFGTNRYSFTWSEVALVLGLVMLPSGWVVIVGTLAVALAQAVTRRPPVKLLFNTVTMASGSALARVICSALGVPDPQHHLAEPRTWLAAGAATAAFCIWNSGTVGMAVAYSQDLPVRRVWRAGAAVQSVVWLGNTLVGMGVATVTQQSASSLFVLPFFLGLLWVAYASCLRLARDRDTWQVLHDTSAALARLERAEIADVVVDRAAVLLSAEFVELLLVEPDGEHVTSWRRTSDGSRSEEDLTVADIASFWPRVEAEREMFTVDGREAPAVQRTELGRYGLRTCVVAPLLAKDSCVGALRIGFHGPVRLPAREQRILRTFANQLAISIENARLYELTREEREKLGQVVDNTSDGILSVDARGRITSWNRAMAQISGLAEADALGLPFTVGHGASDVDGRPIGATWLWAILDANPNEQVKVAINRDGTQRWLSLSVSAVRDSAHAVGAAVVVARDVTALHEASRAKEEFLATVSHELRTPLTSLKGWMHTLMRDDFRPSDADRDEIHSRLLHQTHRLHELIEDLLSASALDRGEFRVQPVTLAVDDVVDKAIDDFRHLHPGRTVHHERAGLAGLAHADPGRLEQILSNLLSNAAKYSPADTPVTVEVSRYDGEVRISVTDEGYGIPPDQLDAIFECFHRLGDHLTRAQPGTGVGLHIARRLVEAMHGRIWVTSRPGAGSRFTFSLPAASLVAGRVAS